MKTNGKKTKPVPILLPRASRNFPNVKKRNKQTKLLALLRILWPKLRSIEWRIKLCPLAGRELVGRESSPFGLDEDFIEDPADPDKRIHKKMKKNEIRKQSHSG